MNSQKAKEKQAQFLKKIEDVLPKNTSLVNELSEVLELSTDSAYRRMRLETFLSIEEILTLCEHFNISFDAFESTDAGVVNFNYTHMAPKRESFMEYLEKLVTELQIINKSKEKQIIYACEDIPIFHHYEHPVLASFKMFYWMHSIMSIPELEHIKFDSNYRSEEFEILGNKIAESYKNIPSIEIWTETTIQSTIKQIEYFLDSGKFKSTNDALAVCNALRDEILVIQKQAEKGSKFLDNENSDKSDHYQLYFSEVEITNNCVYVNIGSLKSVYLGHFTFSTMSTFSESYCKETFYWLNNIIKKSILISGVSEKQRYQVFNKYFKTIDALKTKIENS